MIEELKIVAEIVKSIGEMGHSVFVWYLVVSVVKDIIAYAAFPVVIVLLGRQISLWIK